MAGNMKPMRPIEGGGAKAGEAARRQFIQILSAAMQKALQDISGMVDEFGRTELDGKKPFAIAALKGEIERILVGTHNGIVGGLQEGSGGGDGEAESEAQ